jgi:ligand-binding sensor domain-containing protein
MKKNLFLFAISLFSALTIRAQWETHGPYGGSISSVLTASGAVYAGTGNGVFKSTDNGATYMAANKGMMRVQVTSLSANTAGIFAGTASNGVYFSSDNGATWSSRSNGITTPYITSVYANSAGVFAGTPDGVFFSSNNGITWAMANNGIPITYDVYAWAQKGDTVYATTYGVGMYWSSNNGGLWTQVQGGLPAGTPSTSATYIYAVYADGNTMFAGTSMGIYTSANGGLTWTPANSGMPSGMWARAFTSKAGYVFAGTHTEGIFVSTNGGSSWTASSTGIMNWPKNNGLPHNYPTIMALTVSGGVVLAATSEGMYRSTDNGATWSYMNEGILATDVVGVALNSTAAFAGTSRSGMFVSTDHGATWMRRNTGLPSPEVLAVATASNRAFVSLLNHKVYVSSDNGMTWTSASNGLFADVLMFASTDTKIYAITRAGKYYNQKLYVSTDYGMNWTEVMGSNAISGGMSAIGIFMNRLYIGTYNGMLFRSDDNGDSWRDIGTYLPSVAVTAILPLADETYVGTAGKGMFKVTGDDYVVSSINAGVGNPNITDLALQNDIVFASTWGGGIYGTGNKGQSWFSTNEGLEDKFVYAIAGESLKMYAGTDAGVYLTQSEAFAKFAVMAGLTKPKTADELLVYPNPAKENLYVQNPAAGVSIEIFDLTGRMLISASGDAGTVPLDIRSLNKGLYFVKLTTADEVMTKQIIKE